MNKCPNCELRELESDYFAGMFLGGVFMTIVGAVTYDDHRIVALLGIGGVVLGALCAWIGRKMRRG